MEVRERIADSRRRALLVYRRAPISSARLSEVPLLRSLSCARVVAPCLLPVFTPRGASVDPPIARLDLLLPLTTSEAKT